MTVKLVYKIRHKPTGLFSTGGMDPNFTSKGKVWSSIGHLKNHLNFATENHWNRKHIGLRSEFKKYGECEIVTYEMVSNEQPGPFDMDAYFTGNMEKQIAYNMSMYGGNSRYYKDYFPMQVTYLDGTRKIIDPLDSLNGNAPT